MPGARAWSSGNESTGGWRGSDEGRLEQTYNELSPGGIRADSRYVFPDGSVRRGLGTAKSGSSNGEAIRLTTGTGETKDAPVPIPLVGTSRGHSADFTAALGIDAFVNSDGKRDGHGGDSGGGISGRRRRTEEGGGGGAYRGPGAAPGAGWDPGGRPPRAFVPFLNLPAFKDKDSRAVLQNGSGTHERDRQREQAIGATYRPLSRVGKQGEGRDWHRGRPLAGIGGLLVSPGRAMITGPGRPGSATSEIPSLTHSDVQDEDGRTRRRRRRHRRSRRRRGCDSGNHSERSPEADGNTSDGVESSASGSTDLDFLRRRAEAKLISLERREAVEDSAGEGELCPTAMNTMFVAAGIHYVV